VGYGKRALAAAQAPNTGPGLVYKRASALALGCNTVPVLAWCTLGDLPYYIVTLHCRRSTSDRPAADDDGKSGIEARKLEIMIARAPRERETPIFRKARDWITADERAEVLPVRYPGYVSHGKGARRARNKQKSFEPACLPARKRGYAISSWIRIHVPYREHCVRTVDDALADAVWLIKIAADIGIFY